MISVRRDPSSSESSRKRILEEEVGAFEAPKAPSKLNFRSPCRSSRSGLVVEGAVTLTILEGFAASR